MPDGPASPPAAVDQRARILEVALKLMGERGVHAMSMRSLASHCGLNVATLYHYFASKDEILAGVIEHRDYESLLATAPPIDLDAPPRQRLAALLGWIWTGMGEHDDLWRLLLGESLRGNDSVLAEAAELSATFEAALHRWLREGFADAFDDLAGGSRTTARVLRGVIYGFFVENLPLPAADREAFLARRAEEVAAVFVRT